MAPQMRVVDAEGQQVGVMDRLDALNMAREQGLDLVEIASQAKPPICRIIDYKKFKYEMAKKDRDDKKKIKKTGIKEIQMWSYIDPHMLEVRISRIKEHLKNGFKARVIIKFKGRAITHPEFGREKMAKINEAITEVGKVETPSQFQGKNLMEILSPLPKHA